MDAKNKVADKHQTIHSQTLRQIRKQKEQTYSQVESPERKWLRGKEGGAEETDRQKEQLTLQLEKLKLSVCIVKFGPMWKVLVRLAQLSTALRQCNTATGSNRLRFHNPSVHFINTGNQL